MTDRTRVRLSLQPHQLEELEAYAGQIGLTLSETARMLVLTELARVKNERRDRERRGE